MNDKEIDYQLAICDAFELAVCPTRKIMCVEEAQEMQVRVEEFRCAARTFFPQALRELKAARARIAEMEDRHRKELAAAYGRGYSDGECACSDDEEGPPLSSLDIADTQVGHGSWRRSAEDEA